MKHPTTTQVILLVRVTWIALILAAILAAGQLTVTLLSLFGVSGLDLWYLAWL